MSQTVFIFIAGLGGVFMGMAMLYLTIRITSVIITKWIHAGEEG